mgnify:CR=1 FL=1
MIPLRKASVPNADDRLKVVVHLPATPEEAGRIAANVRAIRFVLRELTGPLFGRLSMEVVSPDAAR